jgi:hypothetical protein
MSLTKAIKRATCAGRCWRVIVSVQRYSVQYKEYNLVGVTTVEGGTTRGTTALVYCRAYIQGLYRDARVHPTGLTIYQGCRQVSTA